VARCAGFKPDNTPCERIVDDRYTYCYSHDPARKEQRRRAASKAGKAKPGSEVAELKSKLAKLYEDTRAGRCASNVGQVCATIAGVELKVLDLLLREREVRIKEIELERIKVPEFEQLQAELAGLKEMVDEKSSGSNRRSPWAG
jgi:hypothetical protein